MKVFLLSGAPGPGMLDLISESLSGDESYRVVFVDRTQNDIIPELGRFSKNVRRFVVKKNGMSFRRIVVNIWIILGLCYWGLKCKNLKIHSHTLDNLFNSVFVKVFLFPIKKNVSVSYELRDLLFFHSSNSILSNLLRIIELKMLNVCEKVICSSPKFSEFMVRNGLKTSVVIVENIPRKTVQKKLKDLRPARKSKHSLIIGYIGVVRYIPQLNNLVEAINKLRLSGFEIELVIAGGGNESHVKSLATRFDFITAYGPFEYEKSVADYYELVDAVYAVYDHDDFNCKLALPNKLYECVFSQRPILVAKNTYLAQLVQDLGIGMSVGKSVQSIMAVLREMDNFDAYTQCREKISEHLIGKYETARSLQFAAAKI